MQTLTSPTDHGYHCNGECWNEIGGSKRIIDDFSIDQNAKLAWFVNEKWAKRDNLQDIEVEDISWIHPIQDYVNMNGVRDHIAIGEPDGSIIDVDHYPMIFKFHNHWFIFQGTHRIVASHLLEKKTIQGWIVDLDD